MFEMKKVLLVGLFLAVFSGLAFALPSSSNVGVNPQFGGQADIVPLPVPSLSLAVVQVPTADIVEPVPVATSDISSPEPRSEPSRGSGSSLTITEMKLVMGGGRNYNPFTKTWGYRDAFTGMMRERFMLSWEEKRQKVGAIDLLPYDLRYSK